jgi:hypothetical protein
LNSTDGNALEVGVKFRSDTAGFISGIRFYKLGGNTGTHIGNLWSGTGTLLATATFSGETASGWQQVNFSAPVAINANTTYVASYFAPVGHYAADANGLTSNVDNSPLHALSSGSSSGNGVYIYSGSSAFPTNTFSATNYWVDVVFNTTANVPTNTPTPTPTATGTPSTCPCSLFTPSTVPTTVANADTSAVELGMSSTNTGTHVANLWTSTGTLLATATFSGETASGWQQVNFTTPVAVTAGTTYVVSYHTNTGHYSSDQNYFTSSVDRAPLHAPASGGPSGGNGLYMYGGSSAFPTNTYNASNYYVDVVFTTP